MRKSPSLRSRVLIASLLLAGGAALCSSPLSAGPEQARQASVAKVERPFLAPALGSHMVLQRDQVNRFWGWTTPGAKVQLTIEGTRVETTAGADGLWLAEFAAPPAGGPYRIRIAGPQSVELEDVLCGDVWLCSGQSNMNWPLKQATNGERDAGAASLPGVRLFRVRSQVGYDTAVTLPAQWQPCEPGTAAEFSAVAFHFGRKLNTELGVPIGLVQSALGGSPIESWMSPAALGAFPAYAPRLAEIKRLATLTTQRHGSFLMHWLDEYDAGSKETSWAKPDLDEKDWVPVKPASAFADLGLSEVPAIAWFRFKLQVPAPLPPGQARLKLGVVDKMDTCFVNGKWTGASSWVENPRDYVVPAEALRPGENLIAIRVAKLSAKGGFMTPDKLQLVLGDGTTLPLVDASWLGRISHDARPPAPLPLDGENYPTMPTVLQQGMLAPIAPLALTGAVWYQGEANFVKAWDYRTLLPALIADWRTQFRAPHLPVFVISLPAFMKRKDSPSTDGWAELRDAQFHTARIVPLTDTVVTIDTGDADDIHPRDKTLVGERTAALALTKHYGRELTVHGPELANVERQDGTLRLRFEHATKGLELKLEPGAPSEFALAGADQVWHWAQVSVEGDTLVLSSPKVPSPVAARYAWQANPRATLFNGAGLPAAPFRTDAWPLSTQPK